MSKRKYTPPAVRVIRPFTVGDKATLKRWSSIMPAGYAQEVIDAVEDPEIPSLFWAKLKYDGWHKVADCEKVEEPKR